jgi:hypothetical protein
MTTLDVPITSHVTRQRWVRWLPLAGTASAATFAIGTLTIGEFPDSDTAPAALARYYAYHHDSVARGGRLLTVAAVLGGLFAAALVLRALRAPVAAAVIAVGGGAVLAHNEWAAASYTMVGHISTLRDVTPQALQAWHLAGAEFGAGSSVAVLMIGVALAGLLARAVPMWLAWPGLVLGLAQLLPGIWGFWAGLVLVLWTLVAGVVLSVTPVDDVSR